MKSLAAFLAFVMLTITGCTPVQVKPAALDVHIDPQCRMSCFSEADLNKDFAELLRDCNVRRALCGAALDRAQEAGAIK